MYKKIVFILIIIAFCITLILIFKKEPKETYTLVELKDLLKQTETMVICLYDVHNPYEICSDVEIVESITDKSKIEQIISFIMPLDVSTGTSTMEGAALVVHALDENENLLVNVFYSPYIGIEKGDSFYYLGQDVQIVQSITETFNIDTDKVLMKLK